MIGKSNNLSALRWYYILWHVLATAAIVLSPILLSGTPFWQLDSNEGYLYSIVAVGYFSSAVCGLLYEYRIGASNFIASSIIGLAVFSLVFLWLLIMRVPYARSTLLELLALAMILILGSFAVRRMPKLATLTLASLALAALGLSISGKRDLFHLQAMESESRTILTTALYNIVTTEYQGKIPWSKTRGGGLAGIGSQIVLVTGDGRMFVLKWTDGSPSLDVRQLPYQAPLNADEFVSGTRGSIDERRFRAADVLVQDIGENLRIFISHHFWKIAEQCFVVRVSTLSVDKNTFLITESDRNWKTVFESTPCLRVREAKSGERGELPKFSGHQTGGRLALLDSQTLLLTVGDHRFDGVNSDELLPQDSASSYGKTIRINLADNNSEIFSSGHRNPQGLYVDRNGRIWLTEQGPQGGDELNLIMPSSNYGWPLVTFGTDYGSFVWPLNEKQGSHNGYQNPVFAWLPAIGTSNLIGIEKSLFPLWHEDLVIASLKTGLMIRARIRDGRVIYVEPIRIGRRIRDILEADDGTIVLWTDDSSIITFRPADETQKPPEERGQLLFASCTGCHAVNDGKTHAIGPDLAGVVGRRIASADGYVYSNALNNLSGRWTEETLDAFLANPQSFAPDNSMIFNGFSDSSDRAAIISYLETQR